MSVAVFSARNKVCYSDVHNQDPIEIERNCLSVVRATQFTKTTHVAMENDK